MLQLPHDFAPVASSTGAPRHSARLKSLERLSMDHIVSLARVFDALRRRTRDFLNPRQPFFALHARTLLSQRNIFASARIGNFDDARRSNANANARETRRNERNVFITSNDASIVARGAPRGVAQIYLPF